MVHHALKHWALRMWIALLVSMAASLTLFGTFSLFGEHLALAASLSAIVFSAVLAGGGWLGDGFGKRLVEHHQVQASAWQQSGNDHQARRELQRAVALCESFLVSPSMRHRLLQAVSAEMARFCVGQPESDRFARSFLTQYLSMNPDDEAASRHWLREMATQLNASRSEMRTAVRVLQHHKDRPDLQGQLAELFRQWQRSDSVSVQADRWRQWMEKLSPARWAPGMIKSLATATGPLKLPWAAVVLLMIAGGLAAWAVLPYGMKTNSQGPEADESSQQTQLIDAPDQYTIQVAAYVTPDGAMRLTKQLRNKQLEAYWNTAKGEQRTWYQVRISTFAQRTAARQFGEQLKRQGIIDDFYVTKYHKP